jgi:hypothetical protein
MFSVVVLGCSPWAEERVERPVEECIVWFAEPQPVASRPRSRRVPASLSIEATYRKLAR